jgi:hypothetical protein
MKPNQSSLSLFTKTTGSHMDFDLPETTIYADFDGDSVNGDAQANTYTLPRIVCFDDRVKSVIEICRKKFGQFVEFEWKVYIQTTWGDDVALRYVCPGQKIWHNIQYVLNLSNADILGEDLIGVVLQYVSMNGELRDVPVQNQTAVFLITLAT